VNCRDRVLAALRHEEPDRVPLFFTNAMPRFIERWRERYESGIEADDVVLFAGHDHTMEKHLGFDAAWSDIPMPFGTTPDPAAFQGRLPALKPGQNVGTDGRVIERSVLSGREHWWYVGPALRDPQLWLDWFDRFVPAPLERAKVTAVRREYADVTAGPNGGFVPMPVIGGVYEPVVESLGLEQFSRLCRKDVATLERILDKMTGLRVAHARIMAEAGIDVAVIGDDSAYKGRPAISPATHRALIVPRYKRIADTLHRGGVKLLLHSDGFTEPYFPGLIEAGIDGVHTIEVAAGMDLGRVKRAWGDRLFFAGPVDCGELLTNGTPARVAAEVHRMITIGAPGGGFAMGPCTALLDTIPLDNVHAMVSATKKMPT
jgi:uroporphyrinogen decarboxylase